ncbi:LacI family DNA-binding transcriptional regulator [Paenisporosarcina antarctica]|uniref:LacI family transcriptional regulator n=1 Tax=Paenisporosarcina antarctica TaxID=417367 RepID=A0A4P7A2M0_9BACL|nr:LacI family DNA-binding transcriptional regulator [Paenisporosarcina antarctica]QBP43191.1 LacI family transcriptional regulator [Paenisporosarcina antarctica]
MSVNIRDIAIAANVSTATVSRVISGKPGVGEETIKYVQSIIENMGYRPNISARSLASNKTGNIGIVSSRTSDIVIGNPFFSTILDGVSNVLDSQNFNMSHSFTLSQQKRLFDTHSVDGIIVLAARKGDKLLDWLYTTNIPTVIIGSFLEDSPFPTVRPNDEQGVFDAVKHLISYGHREIVLVNGPESSIKSQRCREGFLKAMEEEGITVGNTSIIEAKEYTMFSSFEACENYFSNNTTPCTAMVCSSDFLAIGVLKAAVKNNISVPNDLSVIGFGNVPLTEFTNPELTTMHTDLKSIGKEAAKILISLIEGKTIRKKERVYPMQLVQRNSVSHCTPIKGGYKNV